ncbi:MAG TPA: peptide chain release factor N(5)-glutamine methyltransferase [Pyrinomonadaceae bacterium]|jgi:release factor glutamine methyltransferase|nr:peptide chain release factor N(5)-glutamine methyltransferase [Pyrinomonadaceae bacterium]
MTISIAEAILQGALKLRKAGVPEARREAGSLVAHALGQDRSFIITHAEDPIAEQQAAQFHDWLERRAGGEPLQYITGHQEFFGLDFEVTKDVLIPRPETELLVETALKLARESESAPFICDVGTGSGCIVISLLHELREHPGARALAIDFSPPALEVAKRNAERHSVSDRIEFVISDCFSALNAGEPGDLDRPTRSRFDLIVSNPPYVTESALAGLQREVRDFEPRAALAAGPDGLAIIRRLLIDSISLLTPGGHFIFEIGFDQSAAVEQLLDPKIWKLLDIHKDLQGIPRIVALRKLS